MKTRASLLLIPTLLLVMLASGCSFGAPGVKKAGAVVMKATQASPNAKIEGTLPQGTPKDLPLWPGSRVESGGLSRNGAYSLTLMTAGKFDDIVSGMNAGFESAGWSVAGSQDDTATVVLEVSNDAYEGLVTISGLEGGNSLEYLLTSVE